MNRNQRATRNNQTNNKPFVSGGIISNFTNSPGPNTGAPATAPAPIPLVPPIQKSTIQINIQTKPAEAPAPVPAPAPVQLPMVENPQNDENVESMDGDSNAPQNGGLKRRFMRQPIPKKIKRLRRNRRLRKILTPKNALMSLHELLGTGLSEFSILPEERGFVASVFVNNVQYEGRGQSKMAAKNNASEKALRDIIIQRMLQSPKAQALKATAEGAAAPAPNADDLFREDVDMADGENENDEEGEVPMLHLASFALHKLFSEWQSEGFEIPDFKIGGTISPTEAMAVDKPPSTPGVPPKRTTLPENANAMHPTTLLCMMRPATKYVDLGSEGQVPNILHRVGVEVDSNHFIGAAKNKKLARKFAAVDACNQCFGTEFIKDEN